uniref:EMI domain-containing protein n=1 Tax=Sus scrofa TaxID=9823 RepID=A0A8D0N5S6_PIG
MGGSGTEKNQKSTFLWSLFVADAQLAWFREGWCVSGSQSLLASLAGFGCGGVCVCLCVCLSGKWVGRKGWGEGLGGKIELSLSYRVSAAVPPAPATPAQSRQRPAPAGLLPAARGGEEGARRARGRGAPSSESSRGGCGAVSLSAPEGPGAEGGERVSMAPRLRGLLGRAARRFSVSPGGAGARISAAGVPPGSPRRSARPLPVAGDALVWPNCAAPSTGRRTSLAPRAPHTNFCPASSTSAPGSDLGGAGVARGAQLGWRLEPFCPAAMTWRLWLWCFCSWVAAGWPPGSALQLRPGMPNVCEEQQLTVVGLPHPCVQAFTHTVKIWKQGCTSPRGCVGYERRTRYYTVYRQAYSVEQQTVYRCCPGWSQWDGEPGCPRCKL